MSSSSDPRDTRPAAKGGPFQNIPAPAGSKAGQGLGRFIPREELGAFKTWQPGAFTGLERRAEDRRKEDRGTGDRRSGGAPAQTAGAAPAAEAPPAAAGPSAAEWQARITAARKAGYQDGYRDGLVALEGFKQSFAQQNTAQIGALLSAFDEQLQALDGHIAQAVAHTAVALARQVLRWELRQHPELVADVARQAVNTVMHSARQVTVHVHPQDLPLVSQGAEEALAARGARLLADSALQRGSVLVDSDVGSVDARLDTRWAEAVAALGVPQAPLEPAPTAAAAVPPSRQAPAVETAAGAAPATAAAAAAAVAVTAAATTPANALPQDLTATDFT